MFNIVGHMFLLRKSSRSNAKAHAIVCTDDLNFSLSLLSYLIRCSNHKFLAPMHYQTPRYII